MNERAKIVCPKCGSDDVYKDKLSLKAFVIGILLLGFPLPFFKKKYHCFNCGNDFVPKRDKIQV